ncbi:condensin complex subunit 1 [Coccinella septempunctata]|uniref:condensin complex subunit 1 n=1 Tax=Coccinella septempunctata TaxID=41139 RepID=UPI001D066A29|nr:condensin complex subunit 1 [Coccinella septempunctata]
MESFEIPSHRSELNVDKDLSKNDIISYLQEAKSNYKNGTGYIIEECKAYFSAIYHSDILPIDIIHSVYVELHRGLKRLNEDLGPILSSWDDEDADESLRQQYLNMIKIHLYCYTQIIFIFESKEEEKQMKSLQLKKSKKKDDSPFCLDKKQIVVQLNTLIQHNIKSLWSPPIVEGSFINLVSEVCYRFLQNSSIKGDKNVLTEIWSFLGTLIKDHNHGNSFVIRIVDLIKLHEHLVQCLPEGFKFLVENYNCKAMLHNIIQEVTEWQTNEKYQDAQGARFCSSLLVEMAILMPDLMLPEVMYLTRYLYYDSYTLRNCVLSVITEVISKVLTKHDLTEEEKEFRDEFIAILKEHIGDSSPLVRSKVFQHWARLQKENSIPLVNQNEILEMAIEHLRDKGSLVRKCAANLVTLFLSHNAYSYDLKLAERKKNLEEVEGEIKKLEEEIQKVFTEVSEELEAKWALIKNDVKEELEKDFEEETEAQDIPREIDDVSEVIKMYLEAKDYKSAVKLCRTAEKVLPTWKNIIEGLDGYGKVELTLELLKTTFVKPTNSKTEELYKRMGELNVKAEFLRDTVTFLTLVDSAIEHMVKLLETPTIGELHEAVEFLTTAYQFNIDRNEKGIVEMLRIMQRNEQERKDVIVNAFKTIYLKTDAENLTEHTTIIVKRLISLLKYIPVHNLEDLQSVLAEWAKKGFIDNGVIDMLWQFFTNKVPTSEEDRRASLELLRMTSIKRVSIIKKNIKLISTIALEKKGDKVQEDMLLVGTACKALGVVGREKIDMNSETPPFKINAEDEVFQSLLEIMSVNFFKNVHYYSSAIPSVITFIYKVCSKPEAVCENLLRNIIVTLTGKNEKELSEFQLVRFCQLLGCIAVSHLDFMDNTLYKELKRRNNIREQKKKNKKSDLNKSRNSSKINQSVLNQTNPHEESILEGAQAEDSDAEFILSVLENDTVNSSGLLGKLSFIIKKICQRPDLYSNSVTQGAAVIALIRYMLVSSRFCEENIQLLFTIFEKTTHADLKCTVLYHCSDLLTRFPNIVEPWTPRIYQSLVDPLSDIRKATFFTLSNLILRDMIRIQGHISTMAKCIIDQDVDLNKMSRTFFVQLSHKENNLYNILPDIFSHLVETTETEDLRVIMRFLFDLMDKKKYMENLVERFCCKFQLTENVNICRNIMFCLTLITYNEKALKKLQENFPLYKHLVHDDEIYTHVKQILANCNKQQIGKTDLKPIITEIEQAIESVFEIMEGDQRPPPRPVINKKSTKKTQPNKGKTKRAKRKKESSDEDESD